jgi:hypothetical protein
MEDQRSFLLDLERRVAEVDSLLVVVIHLVYYS